MIGLNFLLSRLLLFLVRFRLLRCYLFLTAQFQFVNLRSFDIQIINTRLSKMDPNEMDIQQQQATLNQGTSLLRKGSTQIKQSKQQDTKSVFVQSVDYGTTVQELQAIFQDCGTIVRITILKQKLTNKPKGCAYIEFAEVQSVFHALMLSGTKLRNRAIKVSPKRTNIRGMSNNRGGMSKQFLFNKLLNTLGHRGR